MNRISKLLCNAVAVLLIATAVVAGPPGLVSPVAAQDEGAGSSVLVPGPWVPVDFRTWDIEGVASSWSFANEGRTLVNGSNQNGFSYAVFPGLAEAVEIRGTISVQTSQDDDMVGGVFGLTKPIAANGDSPQEASSVAWVWKQATSGAPEGFTLSRFSDAPLIPGDIVPLYWEDGPGVELLDSDLSPTTGWSDFVRYDYVGRYTPDRVEMSIDGETVLAADGSFEAGSFGVSTISQPGATFEDFEYRILTPAVPAADAGPDQSVPEGSVVQLSGTAAAGQVADPAVGLYESSSGELPTEACSPWEEIVAGSAVTAAVETGGLRLSSTVADGIRYWIHRGESVSFGDTLVIEVDLQAGAPVVTNATRTHQIIGFTLPDGRGNNVNIGDGEAFLLAGNLQRGATASLDTTTDMVRYEVRVDTVSGAIAVRADGELILEGSAFVSPSAFGNVPRVWVGDGTRFAAGTSLWQSVRHNSYSGPSDCVFEAPALTEWQVVSSDGPPIQLVGADTLSPSFVAVDDGVYTLRLTATVGDQTSSDDVTITVVNADPETALETQPTAGDGLNMVSVSFTDPGVADSHLATFDWGDGSVTENVAGVQGTGWGAITAAHVYDAPGTYDVAVTMVDDDGGTVASTSTAQIDVGGVPQAAAGVAIWGDDPDAKEAVKVSGGRHQVRGLLHSNSAFVNSGNDSVFLGGTQFVNDEKSKPEVGKNTYDPLPTVVGVQDRPVTFDVADYQPGGRAAVAAGDSYVDLTEFCGPKQDQTWKPEVAIEAGLYWVPCKKVELKNKFELLGPVTIVTTGQILVPAGERLLAAPFIDGLLFYTVWDDGEAIKVNNGGSVFGGYVVSEFGLIKVDGEDHTFHCGVIGERVEINGGDHVFDSSLCGSIDSGGGVSDGVEVAAPPLLVPDLTLSANAPDLVAPGAGFEVTSTSVNSGVQVTVPGLVALSNASGSDAVIDDAVFVLERFDVASQAWAEVVSSATGTANLVASGVDLSGVTLTEGAIAPATVTTGSSAVWSVLGSTVLDAAAVDQVTDPALTSGLRARVDLSISGSELGLRQTTRFGGDLLTAFTDGTQLTAVRTRADSGQGAPPDAGPTDLGLGETLDGSFSFVADTIAPRGENETEGVYLARLQDRVGALSGTVVRADGTAFIGTVYLVEDSNLKRLQTELARGLADEVGSAACQAFVNAALGISLSTNANPGSSNAFGAAGEEFVSDAIGAPKNTAAFLADGRDRIPDFVTDTNVIEVKNTKYLSGTQQIKDYIEIANEQKKGPLVIVTRQNTILRKSLRDLIEAGSVKVVGCLPGF